MCGIAGSIGWIDEATVSAVDRINAAQTHRGPDDCGRWQSGPGGVGAAFAFRRLAILDLSPGGHQPMIDKARGNVIVFNGEIYNFRELRRDLERRGEQFHSSGDTETLLKGYGKWGIDVIHRLRGMFALAIWDARSRRVLLARDRMGIKPLYYATVTHGGREVLLFGSELRALLNSGFIDRKINAASLSTYIWNGFVIGPDTIISGVRMLPAAHYAIIDPAEPTLAPQRYWNLPVAAPARDGMEQLQHALTTASQQHLLSDAPLGVFLSGGIDSSAVTALAARHGGSTIRTFNISFDESAFDESPYARAVANSLGTRHTEIKLTQQHFRDHLHEALASVDQPTFDAINTYFVSRAAREAGMTVALAGTGGDELFGGYRSFRDNPRAARICRTLSAVPAGMRSIAARTLGGLLHRSRGDVPPQTRWGKLADLLATDGQGVEVHQVSYSLFTRAFMQELLREGVHRDVVAGLPRDRAAELKPLANGHLDLHAVSMLELSCFIGERLLRDTDCTSMAVSLEVRVPLLDHEVVEAAAKIDPSRRFLPLGKKPPLRSIALNALDQSIFDRPKSGFVLPIETWCRSQLQDELDATFADRGRFEAIGINQCAAHRLWQAFGRGAPGIYWSRVWSLFVLAKWCEMNRVSF
jgi:asparagine synthase (glutamine-hydrolysing)